MSSEQRWIISDVLGLLLQISRSCCLAPVRFVKISTDNFIYISRPLFVFSVIITSIVQLYAIYLSFLLICSTERKYYKQIFFLLFNPVMIIVSVSYAVLHSETRIKNYMTCFTKLKLAIRGLQSTEEYKIKKWHVLVMFITLSGSTFELIITAFINSGSIDSLTCVLVLNLIISVALQQQFLYFSLYVSFVLKIIKQQLQKELSKIITNKDGKPLGNFTTAPYNIPLGSINKAIDMIGMNDKLFPDVITTRNQNMADRVHQINDCYVLTCEVLRALSSSDEFFLFLQLISFSLNLVFSSYTFIKLFYQDGSFLTAKMVVQSLQLCLIAMRLIMVVEPCHVAHETILKIRFLVCEIKCHVTSKNDPVFRVMEGFFHQLVLNDISYTALGICKIGRPLVTSILGVITTALTTFFEF